MASMTFRRLSAMGKGHWLRRAMPSANAVTPRLGIVHPCFLASNQRVLGDMGSSNSALGLTIRHLASASAVPDGDQREFSPQPNSSPASQMTYKERLSKEGPNRLNWVPAHWVTTVYKEILGSNHPPTPDDALMLLNCFDVRLAEESPQNRVIMAEKAWQDLKEAGTKLDIRHYNSLLSVYLDNEHAFDPEDFLLILSEDGVAMNDESYSLFVRRYCQTGNVVDAMRTLEFMKRLVPGRINFPKR